VTNQLVMQQLKYGTGHYASTGPYWQAEV